MSKSFQPTSGKIEKVNIDKVVPYWRNPRRLSEAAVTAVKSSIEQYGYAQPVVVDSDYVIIIGHTRYAAMRRLNLEELDVLVADHLNPTQAKQLRVIDNRAGEYAFWDFNKLQEEVTAAESELLTELFPEFLEEFQSADGSGPTPVSWESEPEVDSAVEFVCPSCFHEWEAEVTREQILSGFIPANEGVANA